MSDKLTSWTGPAPPQWNAFYVRVTQEESIKADLSVPNQIARAHEIAASRGWTNYQIYVEPKHVSGELWIDKRPALRRLVEDILAGRVTRVCARHTDRLWRNAEIQSKLLPILREHGVELWDYNQQHDFKSAHGKFSLQVLGAASELEVNLTAERIREMKRGKAQRGKVGGGPPPFGYTSQSRRILELQAAGYSADEAYAKACIEMPIGKCWSIDEKEAEIVRLIFDLYTAPEHRLGSLRIAKHLNAAGHRTRNGLAWLSNYVRRVIDNPAYAGFTSYDESAYTDRVASKRPRSRQQLYAGEHPPIITAEMWKHAQAIKVTENTIKRTKGTAAQKRSFALSGILRCPKCESHMLGKWSDGSSRIYYMCSRRHHGGVDQCSFPLLDAKQLHERTWEFVHKIFSSPKFVMDQLERVRAKLQAEQPESDKRAGVLAKRRDELKAALAKYFAIFESSKDPARDEALMERVKELRAELQTVEQELASAKEHKVLRLPPRLDEERVRRSLEKLRARVEAQPEYQKAIYLEMQREHDLQVRAVSKDEAVVSIALPIREVAAPQQQLVAAGGAGGTARLYSVLAAAPVSRGPVGPGLPEPGPMDPTLVLEHRFRLSRGVATAAEWAEEENAKGHTCACGCGASIKVIARHKWHGIPRYLKAHHPMKMTKEVAAVRADGFMTSQEAARALGIGVTTLLRMEGTAYPPVPRQGKRGLRLFSPEVVAAIREAIR